MRGWEAAVPSRLVAIVAGVREEQFVVSRDAAPLVRRITPFDWMCACE
jgi:hypothetical protein